MIRPAQLRKSPARRLQPLLLALFVVAFPGLARAGCSYPAANEGDFIYNGDFHVMQFCNGTAWFSMGGGSGPAGPSGPPGPQGPAGPPGSPPAGANGQLQFNENGAFGASSNLYWDVPNNRLGIATTSPAAPLHVNGEAILGKSSPALACGSGTEGSLRYNSISKQMEFCNGTNWNLFGTGSNLVAWWQFNEGTGTQTADSSAFANTGTLVNNPTWTAGIAGAALSFDGSGSYVTSGFTRPLNDFTVCAWFSSTSDAAAARIVDKDYAAGFWLGHEGSGTPNQWGGGVMESSAPYGIYVTLSSDGTWHHLCSVRAGTTHTIYGDGGAVTLSNSVSAAPLNSASLAIGATSSAANPLAGIVDDVRVYNRALSAAEILQLYNDQGQ